ncbi:HTH_Tnp_Tc3_2 domain-containing protein [Trichonephila clavipes]|nr:HTH_Tnp_Tc3_2 domain-containing protein [Trichonephila clavipes]
MTAVNFLHEENPPTCAGVVPATLARLVPRQSRHSVCVVRRCWNQWIREMSFTRRPSSERPRRTSCHKDRYIVRNARVQPTGSSSAYQVQVASSLGAPVSSRTIRRHLAEGHFG